MLIPAATMFGIESGSARAPGGLPIVNGTDSAA